MTGSGRNPRGEGGKVGPFSGVQPPQVVGTSLGCGLAVLLGPPRGLSPHWEPGRAHQLSSRRGSRAQEQLAEPRPPSSPPSPKDPSRVCGQLPPQCRPGCRRPTSQAGRPGSHRARGRPSTVLLSQGSLALTVHPQGEEGRSLSRPVTPSLNWRCPQGPARVGAGQVPHGSEPNLDADREAVRA